MRRAVASTVVVLVLVVVGAAWGAEAPSPAVIHATGRAVVPVMADTARVECSVRTQGQDAAEAEREAANTIQQLRNAVTALNLAGLALRDTGVTVSARQNPNWPGMPLPGPDAGGPAPGTGPGSYNAGGALVVTMHGEEAALRQSAAQVMAAVLGATGPNLVTVTPSYLKEDDSAERQQAWELAVKNAVANAQALACGLGVTITGYGELSMIPTTTSQNPWEALLSGSTAMSQAMMERMFGGELAEPNTQPLQVDVTVYLDALYE